MTHAQLKPPEPQPPALPVEPVEGAPHCDEKTENTFSVFRELHLVQAGPPPFPAAPERNCSKTCPHEPQRYSYMGILSTSCESLLSAAVL
jgi:hypothetical protein